MNENKEHESICEISQKYQINQAAKDTKFKAAKLLLYIDNKSFKKQNSCCISSDFSIANSSHILFIYLFF